MPVNRVKTLPPIGKADHDIVLVEYDIKSKRVRQTPRKIYLYKRADMDGLKSHLGQYRDNILNQDLDNISTNDLWTDFKTEIIKAMDTFVPSKMTKSRVGHPWINTDIKKLLKRREKLFRRSRRSNSPHDLDKYKEFRSKIQKKIRDAHWKYVNDIFTPTEDENPKATPKKFWSYINSLRSGQNNIASLRENGILRTDSKDKANILNNQFHSVFTEEGSATLPPLGKGQFPNMKDIDVDPNGVRCYLGKLNPNKASGPDTINARILKECCNELGDILTAIFNRSLRTGQVPDDWRKANVAPIFKKGEKYDPSNYRPVSLTCICCKVLEHILVSNIMKHLQTNDILVDSQHGFRSRRSCDTQLVQFIHDIALNLDKGYNKKHKQTDVIVMDFAKAFDKVPHKRLLYKLDHYGVGGTTNRWITSWLSDRTQEVVLDGTHSDSAPVISGVPQGSCLGPILFLLFINDLPDGILTNVRLFADDCVLYKNIHTPQDCIELQNDLMKLGLWEQKWLMKFNVSKCHSLRITRHRPDKQIDYNYTLHGQTLDKVNETKYLGVTITNTLNWTPHIQNITNKATKTLGLLRRNLSLAPREIKVNAFQTLVRPQLEYASPIWNPHTQVNKHKIEMVQRTAARWTCRRWHNTSHVGEMLEDLKWPSLEQRRTDSSLTFFYKMQNRLVDIDRDRYLTNNKSTRHSGRLSHSQQYDRLTTSSDLLKFSFFPRVIPLWNALPESTVSLTTVDSFKSHLN